MGSIRERIVFLLHSSMNFPDQVSFFFQAEDGIRDFHVTGVQTCALPISLRQYYYFCLDHVREYNAAWDYFRGMSATEIERMRRADIVGDRPSWPLGARAAGTHFDQ